VRSVSIPISDNRFFRCVTAEALRAKIDWKFAFGSGWVCYGFTDKFSRSMGRPTRTIFHR